MAGNRLPHRAIKVVALDYSVQSLALRMLSFSSAPSPRAVFELVCTCMQTESLHNQRLGTLFRGHAEYD
jgi:hypothetical protein